MKRVLLFISAALFATLGVWAQTTRYVPVPYATIQAAVTASVNGDIIEVAAGSYAGNVTIDKNITLISTSGAELTTIVGSYSGGGQGTVYLLSGRNGVRIGSIGHGFTIIGYDDPSIDRAAVYLQSTQANITIEGNIITANGEGAMLGEYNADQNNIIINANVINGTTLLGTYSSSNKWDNLVFFGGVTGASNTRNFTFTNNTISGTAGSGIYGNDLVTLDCSGINTITGNVFSGTTTSGYDALRMRGDGAYTIYSNSFPGSYGKYINRSGTAVSAIYNWWGTTSPSTSKFTGTVNRVPWLTCGIDGDLVAPGFQPSAACITSCATISATSTNTCGSLSTGTASVSITSGGSGSYTYLWKRSATTVGTTATITGLIAATYTVTVTDLNGCTATASTTVSSNPLPVPTITGPSSLLESSTGNIYATEAGMSNYVWTVSSGGTKTAGGTSTDNSVTVTWNTAGAQTVRVSYTNSNGCTAAAPTIYNVTVNPIPATTIQTPTLTPGSLCGLYDVQVKVKNFTEVGAISLVLNYDPAVFSYQSVTLNSVPLASTNGLIPGKFILSYYGDGMTLGTDAVLFTLHFTLLTPFSGATTNLTWSTVSGDCEYAGLGGTPVYTSNFVDLTPSWTIPVRPVKNTTTSREYCTIQAAIDDPATNNEVGDQDVITVAAGIYPENVIVNKSLTILGPKAIVVGCDLSRGTGEAIVVPATNAVESGEIFHVTVSNVSIKGFTIDGDNTLLTSGVTNSIGSDMNAAEGVTVYVDNVNSLTVENNIFQNLAYFGVTLFGGSYSAPATSNHSINNNKFQNLGTYNDPNTDPNWNINAWGGGVLLYNNQYAAVTNNCMTNVRLGIQTGNFSRSNPGTDTYQVMDNNTIQSRRRGIFHNLHYSSTSPYTLSNNTLTALADSHETSYWDGILLASLSVPWTCTGNTINGAGMTIPTHGYQIWNVASTSTALISGGSVFNVTNGVFANNWEGYFNSNGGDGAHATLSNISISPLATGTGIRLHDHPSSTHGNVQIAIGTDVTITGGANGLVVEGSGAKVISPVGNLALNSQTSKYIQLIDNANDIDATAVKFNSQLGSGMSLATLFATEDKIDHKIDLSTLGFVTVNALNDYVTVSSFVASNSTPMIQRGVDAAGVTGWTVNVANGTYNEDVNLNKSLTIDGESQAGAILRGTYAGTNGGSAATLMISASSSKVIDMTVTRDYGATLAEWQACAKNQGITIGNSTTGVSLENLLIQDQRNAVYINNAQNFSVKYCIIENSRTGIQIVNNLTDGVISNNFIRNNFTHGIFINFVDGPLNATNLKINNNSITGNWYSNFLLKGTQSSILTGFDANCNWFGTAPTVNPTLTSEPGYAAQVPVQFGGTNPGVFSGDIRGDQTALLPYIPYLVSGTFTSPGFTPTVACVACAITASETHVNVSCFSNATGSIDLMVIGGIEPYSYSWTGPGTYASSDEDPTGLYAGTYNVTVTAANGCTKTLSVSISEPDALLADINTWQDVNCFGSNNGSARVSASGGTLPYTYLWNDPAHQTSDQADNLVAGYYTVTVTDHKNCTVTASLTIVQPDAIAVGTSTKTDVSCNGGSDGTITLGTVSGGWSFAWSYYVYTWTTTDGTIPAGQENNPNLTGLTAGTYYYSVTNNDNCSPATGSVTINVVDITPPVITCPANVTVNQHDAKDPYSTGYASATDCSGVTITYNDNRAGLNLCNATGTIVRTWTAKDYFSNTSTCDQTITVVDLDNPVVTVPSNITVNNDAGLCSAVVTYTDPTATDFGFFQGFEDVAWLSGAPITSPSTDWNDYNSHLTRVASGTDGIFSKSGSAHGYANSTVLPADPENYTGIFSRLGGYNGAFGLGFNSSVDVYFNLSDLSVGANTYGWDVSCSASTQSLGFLRDFIFHTASNASGQILVAGSNNTNFTRRNDLASINHYTVTTSGWYTLEWNFRNDGSGMLTVDLNLRDAGGALLWTETRNTTDNIATTVGGNRYMWFTFLEVDKLAIDNTTLTRKLAVTPASLSGTAFSKGVNTVTANAQDACGKTASNSFTITVNDNEAPTVSSCPLNISVGTDAGVCSALVNYAAPTFADNCDGSGLAGTMTSGLASGSHFPKGVTTVTYTYTDIANNGTATCTFTVTVADDDIPIITTCAPGQSAFANSNCQAAVPDFTLATVASDNCGSVTITQLPLAGTFVEVGVTPVTITVTDGALLTATCSTTFTVQKATISGTLKYNNPLQTPMNHVELTLNPSGIISTTDGSGSYLFENVCAGNYTISVTNNLKSVGGINSTDAAQVNYWSSNWSTIEHVKFLAGDVNRDYFDSPTDAAKIQRYFVYGETFGTPWSYWKKGDKVNSNFDPNRLLTSFDVVVGGSNLVNFNLYGMCTGDFNGSFTPGLAKSTSSTVQLTYDATKKVDASQEFELPVRVVNETELGAVSLILEIPSDLIEVKDVYLKGSNNKPDFAINGNLLTIGWNSTTPVKLSAGAEMIVLKLRTTVKFAEGNSFRLMLAADPLNELADGYTNVIPDAILNTDVVANGNVGIDEQYGNNGLTLANYPNPFIESTTVHYTLPISGDVTLEIYNMVGQVVKTLVNKPQTSGSYTLKVDARSMSEGIYTTILRVHNGKDDMVKTIKFVVNK